MKLQAIPILFLLLAMNGCAVRRTTGPDAGTINFHASLTQTVLVAEASYEEVLKGLGDAFRAGIITRPTLERGRALGNETRKAIVLAKSTLATYLRAGGLSGGSQAEVFMSLATLATLMAQLEKFYVNETGSVLPGGSLTE